MYENTEEVVRKIEKVEINEKNPQVLIGAYGTLREGRTNWEWALKDKSEFLGTYKTDAKFTMYGKDCNFPIVSSIGDTAIVYDLFRITDEKVLREIHALEGCTGISGHERNWYDIIELQNDEHGTFYMYVQHKELPKELIIPTGDWNDK